MEICDAESRQIFTQLLESFEMGPDYKPDRIGSIEEGPSLLKLKSTPKMCMCVLSLQWERKVLALKQQTQTVPYIRLLEPMAISAITWTITSDFSQYVFRSFISAVCRKCLKAVTWKTTKVQNECWHLLNLTPLFLFLLQLWLSLMKISVTTFHINPRT